MCAMLCYGDFFIYFVTILCLLLLQSCPHHVVEDADHIPYNIGYRRFW